MNSMTAVLGENNLPKIEPSQIYSEAVKVMKPEEIDHHGNGHGMDDLYLKITPESMNLIKRLTTRELVSTFRSEIDGSKWYDLPFCYPVIDKVEDF